MNSNSRVFSMNSYIVDAHIHLSDPDYDSSYLDYMLNYSKFTGTKLFSVSTGLHSSKRTLKLSHSNENIFAFVGIHPMSVLNENYESLETLARTSTSNFSFPKAEAIAIPAGPAPKTRTSGIFPFDIKYKSYD